MFRRSTSLVALAAFVLSSVSCSPYKRVATSPDDVRRDGTTVKVKAIVTTSGERAELSSAVAARVDGERLVWQGAEPASAADRDLRPTVRIARADLEGLQPGQALQDRPVRIDLRTRGGIAYSGDATRQRDGVLKMRVTGFAVPLSAVRELEAQQRDVTRMVLLTAGVGAVALVTLIVFAAFTTGF